MKHRFAHFILVFLLSTSVKLIGQMVWQPTNNPSNAHILFIQPINGALYAGFGGYGLYKTEDAGQTWTVCGAGNPALTFPTCLLRKGNYLFASTLFNGVMRSADLGNTWINVAQGLPLSEAWSLAIKDSLLFVGTSKGVFISNDDGITWYKSNLPTPTGAHQAIFSLLSVPQGIFAGTDGAILRSFDNGQTWLQDSLGTRLEVHNMTMINDEIFAGISGNGVVHKTSVDSAWLVYNEPSIAAAAGNVTSLIVEDTFLIKSAMNGGVFVNGTTQNDGLPSNSVSCLAVHEGYLYAGTYDFGVWKYDLQSLKEASQSRNKPNYPVESKDLSLYVFPNPAATTAFIRFSIPTAGEVSITLLDAKGNRLSEPVEGYFEAAHHESTFELGDLQEGLYYFVLRFNNQVITREIIVVW